jgi:hypothetical protein
MADAGRDELVNGPGAAALLAAAFGCVTLGVLALCGDAFPNVSALLTFWKPTGALSGVTDVAIGVWLATWFLLSRLWARKTVHMTTVNWAALAMVLAGGLLTFPPFMDFLQGK